MMKLIIGLGNPGRKYEKTRHNLGFLIIDNYCLENKISLNKKKFNGLYGEASINNEKVILLKPQSYMNLSGEVIRQFITYFKIEIKDILVIVDDISLPETKIRLRKNGTTAGHNGLKDIANNLKTLEFKRMKIGIGLNEDYELKNFVLSNLDIKKYQETFKTTNEIIDKFVSEDFDKLMCLYN